MQADGSRASYYRIAINLIGGMINSLIGDILWYIAMYPCLQGYMGYVLTAVLLKLIENAHASGYKYVCMQLTVKLQCSEKKNRTMTLSTTHECIGFLEVLRISPAEEILQYALTH